MTPSTCRPTYENIIKVLEFKKLHPPQYFIYRYNPTGFIGQRVSKAVRLCTNTYGIGKIYDNLIYDINNNIKIYKWFYYSEKQRQENIKKNKKIRKKILENKLKKNLGK
jgi:hypothetical protein